MLVGLCIIILAGIFILVGGENEDAVVLYYDEQSLLDEPDNNQDDQDELDDVGELDESKESKESNKAKKSSGKKGKKKSGNKGKGKKGNRKEHGSSNSDDGSLDDLESNMREHDPIHSAQEIFDDLRKGRK